MPEFGIPPTNVLTVPEAELKEGRGSYFVHLILKNVKVHGIQGLKVNSVRFVEDLYYMACINTIRSM